jgi:4-hydroxy-2-oxoheptanedioate aldolase
MGVKHFCIGWDVRILHNWWKVNGEGMRAMIDAATPGAKAAAAPAPKETATTY